MDCSDAKNSSSGIGSGVSGPGEFGPGDIGSGVFPILEDTREFHKILTLRLPGVGVGDIPSLPSCDHGALGCSPPTARALEFLRGGGGILGTGVSAPGFRTGNDGLFLITPVPTAAGTLLNSEGVGAKLGLDEVLPLANADSVTFLLSICEGSGVGETMMSMAEVDPLILELVIDDLDRLRPRSP